MEELANEIVRGIQTTLLNIIDRPRNTILNANDDNDVMKIQQQYTNIEP